MENTEVALGVDIGGTKIKSGIVDCYGNLMSEPMEVPTNAWESREKIISRLLQLLSSMISKARQYKLVGIGVGCSGPLDIKNGVILDCNTLPTLQNYPLKHIIELTCGVDVVMNNDANAMMLGEACWGAGMGYNSVLGFALGTGTGCAFINNGKIFEGSTGNAGEIWLAPYREKTIEYYACGTGLSNIYRDITGLQLTGKEIAEMARVGDEIALETFNQFADALTFALSWTINVLDPDAVIIGGSVANSADLYLDTVESQVKQYITVHSASHVKINKAALGDDAGFVGAAALSFVDNNVKINMPQLLEA